MPARIVAIVLACLVAVSTAARAEDQARRGRLVVSVADQTNAMIPRAKVTVTSQEGGDAAPLKPVMTDHTGVAVIGGLVDGRYTVRVEFPGFATSVLQDVRVRGGDVRRRFTLQLSKFDQEVTVGRDNQSAALDSQGSAFSTVLTREQIDALPDDPDEMEAALKALAPPGAVLRVDGFTGGKLPPKSQIRSIRLPKMDMFAAQNHGGMSGMMFIDIMTMPGNGPLRGNVDFNFLDEALNARNAFTPTKADEQLRQTMFGVSGTIRPNKTGFSINAGVGSQYSSPNLLAVLPDGTTTTDTIRQPRDSYNLNARIDHAINKDHALRVSVDRDASTTENLGVGGYNLFERAYTSESSTTLFRFSENGPVRRRMFTESRVQLKWTGASSQSNVERPTVRVQDAFTGGGGQQRGGQRGFEFEIASDLAYVKGSHSWRTGVRLEGGSCRSDANSNYLGTYTFASLADYNAARASNFTIRVGSPDVTYSTFQAAAYVQDDWRVARSLLISPGVRYGAESHVGDRWNLSPRVSVAWSPRRSGSITLRGSYGYFYDWIPGDLYKQTLLVDGVQQRELNVQDPEYPLPGLVGTTPPTNRYLWSDAMDLPSANRMTVGVERVLTKNSRMNASYSRGWGRGLLRGRNLNYPVAGVRPNPDLANDVELATDASSRSQALSLFYSFVRTDWKRTFLSVNYTWSQNDSNTTGAFQIPASRDNLKAEWGPSGGDIRHRVGASLSMSPVRNVSLGVNVRAQSGTPYNITTGRDDNADGVFNDRPAGVSRNAARGAVQCDLGGRISYGFGFGKPRQAGGPGGMQVVINTGGGGGLAPGFGGGAADKRYRIEFYLTGQNLLNRVNYTAYSFTMTSPLFGQPVAAAQPRKFQMGVRFGF
ncbi:MAG: carboxypeptidase regulatory-like domain-containing protein [Acidobacteria bacterium]|nr:carboxypeptidase regulatory-like domain-containing protein [Acidobacteriota bacterium]